MTTLNKRFLRISRALEDGDFGSIDCALEGLDDLKLEDFVEGMQTLAQQTGERAGEAFLTFLENYIDKNYGNRAEGIAALRPLLRQAFEYDGFPEGLKPYLVSID